MRCKPHVRFGRRAAETADRKVTTALRPDLTSSKSATAK